MLPPQPIHEDPFAPGNMDLKHNLPADKRSELERHQDQISEEISRIDEILREYNPVFLDHTQRRTAEDQFSGVYQLVFEDQEGSTEPIRWYQEHDQYFVDQAHYQSREVMELLIPERAHNKFFENADDPRYEETIRRVKKIWAYFNLAGLNIDSPNKLSEALKDFIDGIMQARRHFLMSPGGFTQMVNGSTEDSDIPPNTSEYFQFGWQLACRFDGIEDSTVEEGRLEIIDRMVLDPDFARGFAPTEATKFDQPNTSDLAGENAERYLLPDRISINVDRSAESIYRSHEVRRENIAGLVKRLGELKSLADQLNVSIDLPEITSETTNVSDEDKLKIKTAYESLSSTYAEYLNNLLTELKDILSDAEKRFSNESKLRARLAALTLPDGVTIPELDNSQKGKELLKSQLNSIIERILNGSRNRTLTTLTIFSSVGISISEYQGRFTADTDGYAELSDVDSINNSTRYLEDDNNRTIKVSINQYGSGPKIDLQVPVEIGSSAIDTAEKAKQKAIEEYTKRMKVIGLLEEDGETTRIVIPEYLVSEDMVVRLNNSNIMRILDTFIGELSQNYDYLSMPTAQEILPDSVASRLMMGHLSLRSLESGYLGQTELAIGFYTPAARIAAYLIKTGKSMEDLIAEKRVFEQRFPMDVRYQAIILQIASRMINEIGEQRVDEIRKTFAGSN